MACAERYPDLYRVLGVAPAASAAEITTAYRRLVRTLHPDSRLDQDASDQTQPHPPWLTVGRDRAARRTCTAGPPAVTGPSARSPAHQIRPGGSLRGDGGSVPPLVVTALDPRP
jgi:DnaJ-like protein